jgi:hypothetical protein
MKSKIDYLNEKIYQRDNLDPSSFTKKVHVGWDKHYNFVGMMTSKQAIIEDHKDPDAYNNAHSALNEQANDLYKKAEEILKDTKEELSSAIGDKSYYNNKYNEYSNLGSGSVLQERALNLEKENQIEVRRHEVNEGNGLREKTHEKEDDISRELSTLPKGHMSYLLMEAVKGGYLDGINQFKDLDFDSNYQNKDGESLLHTSIKKGNREIFDKTLVKNPDLNLKDKDDNTAVLIGLEKDDPIFGYKLVKKGADIKLENNEGISGYKILHKMLYEAIESNNQTFINLFLTLNLNIDEFKDENDHSTLYVTLVKGKVDIARLLMEDINLDKIINEAIDYDNEIIISNLKIIKPDLINYRDTNDHTILSIALEKNKPNVIKLLLLYGASFEEALLNNGAITQIDLSDRDIKQSEFEAIVNKIKHEKTIEHLNLNKTNLSQNNIKNLLETLDNYDAMQFLDLGNNNLNAYSDLLLNVVKHNYNIKTLNLENSNLSSENGKTIIGALNESPNIKHLNISNNNLGNNVVTELVTILNLKDLESLEIKNIGLDHVGIKPISNALEKTNHLTTLDFSVNDFGDYGGSMFRRSAEFNKSIIQLDLTDCKLSYPALLYICAGFLENFCIVSINFKSNNIDNEGAKAIRYLVADNASIVYLNLEDNNITEAGINDIKIGLENNISILSFRGLNNELIDEKITSNNNLFKERLKSITGNKEITQEESFFKNLFINFKQIQYKTLVSKEFTGSHGNAYFHKIDEVINSNQDIDPNNYGIELMAQLNIQIN